MKQIEASKLARGLGAVLERVVAGETIEVIRYGRVVAVLAPPVRREGRTVQPDKLGAVDTPTAGAKPFLRPAIESATKATAQTRQQFVDGLLKGSRGKPGE